MLYKRLAYGSNTVPVLSSLGSLGGVSASACSCTPPLLINTFPSSPYLIFLTLPYLPHIFFLRNQHSPSPLSFITKPVTTPNYPCLLFHSARYEYRTVPLSLHIRPQDVENKASRSLSLI